MARTKQALKPTRILKLSKLLAFLLNLNLVRCFSEHHKVEYDEAQTTAENQTSLHPREVHWAFSPNDLMSLVDEEKELFILIKKCQRLTKSEKQLLLFKR